MLRQLILRNYRGFEDHVVPLRPLTVLVGQNNAGKSTIAEALRLISIVTERLGGLNFRDPPAWADLPLVSQGLRPAIDGLGIDFASICHRYGNPPAAVEAVFETGHKIVFYLHSDGRCHVVMRDTGDQILRTKLRVRRANFPRLHVLPQVAPLAINEQVLTEDYVRKNISSPLAPRHFRNQLRLYHNGQAYRDFRELAEASWPGLQVRALRGARGGIGAELFLGIRDRDFVAEVARMGHGLQMWLQTMWFLARTPSTASVVLDEPDVYMHPDLQRRMIRLVRGRFEQVLVATHSVEIMAEVAPSDTLIINRRASQSEYADSNRSVQSLVERVGGVHNIQLARLWTSKRFLLVEGKDVRLLKLVHDLLFQDADRPLDAIPNTDIGGWGGWKYAVHSTLFIKNSIGQSVTVYCILDRDYHSEAAVQDRLDEATRKNVRLHVWRRKEIENYVLVAETITRVINQNRRAETTAVTAEIVTNRLDEIAESLREKTQDNLTEGLRVDDTKGSVQPAIRTARALVRQAFASGEGKLAIVSGKEMLGALARWSERQYGVTLGAATIIRSMRVEEVPGELAAVVSAIHHGDPVRGLEEGAGWE